MSRQHECDEIVEINGIHGSWVSWETKPLYSTPRDESSVRSVLSRGELCVGSLGLSWGTGGQTEMEGDERDDLLLVPGPSCDPAEIDDSKLGEVGCKTVRCPLCLGRRAKRTSESCEMCLVMRERCGLHGGSELPKRLAREWRHGDFSLVERSKLPLFRGLSQVDELFLDMNLLVVVAQLLFDQALADDDAAVGVAYGRVPDFWLMESESAEPFAAFCKGN